MPPDVEAAREFFRQKSRARIDKRMSVAQAVRQFIHDGDYLASGGFGSVRLSTAVLHEILRQKRHNLGFSGHCATHDFEILAAGEAIDRCDVSYIVGLELRGLSPQGRRLVESGALRTTEWSNGGLGWRFKAAAMGLPYLPARTMLGSDTGHFSAAREVTCPFTGMKLLAFPALYPDVAVIHVHEADMYGNARIDGISIIDLDIAKAAKRLIVTAERLVDEAAFRREPRNTSIPYWLVDAVCLVPYGSYPGNMPYEYAADEQHLAAWLEAEKDPAAFQNFLDHYIYESGDFAGYLERAGGQARLDELHALEPLRRLGEN